MIYEMLKEVKVKENNIYVNGKYIDKKPIYGYYTVPISNSLLDKIEIMAKSKFKLEKDSENYSHEARVLTWLAINEFLEKNKDSEFNEEYFNKWIFTTVKNKLQNLAMLNKSNNSICDRKTNRYEIKNNVSMNNIKRNEEPSSDMFNEFKPSFFIWLDMEGKDVLTKKQIDYLKNNLLIRESNVPNINNRIANKIIKHYGEYQKEIFEKRNVEFKNNFIKTLIKKIYKNCFEEYMHELVINKNPIVEDIIDTIYDELPTYNECKEFTKTLKEGRCVSNRTRKLILNILTRIIKNK